jgi:hypothetical protein
MVLAFPNLSKAVTKEYRALEKDIKLWKDAQDEAGKNEVDKKI